MAAVFEFREIRHHAQRIAEHAVAHVLRNKVYETSLTATWVDDISKIAVEELQRLSENFKYAVSCMIIQKKGAGIHTSASAHWDADTDDMATITWQDNRTMICVCTIFGVAI